MSSLEWMDEGLCHQVDPDLWFPSDYAASQRARQICKRCPVQAPCLDYALAINAAGIWGGTTGRERQEMRGAAYRQRAS